MEQTQKNFRKRGAILEYLRSTHSHPSAEMVYTQLKPQIPDLSLATVYRNLKLFQQQGMAVSVATVGGAERFDANTEPHVHFICTGCGAVSDLHRLEVPQALCGEAERCLGGRVDTCQLSFTGTCGECLSNKTKAV